jgi:signal transduction histidine kinase
MKKHDIQFECNFDPDCGSFEIDAGVVRSALLNILENAVDACREDTSKPVKKIIFSVKKDAGNIIFTVSDNGIGMDQETMENLFTLFYSSKENKGTGLGLFIADKIIRQHGGHISVESSIKKGATLTITMPKKGPEPSADSRQHHSVDSQ